MDTNRSPRKSFKRAAATSALTAGLVLGGLGVASAASTSTTTNHAAPTPGHRGPGGPGGQPGLGGKVTALSATSLTFVDPMGTSHTVALTSATTYDQDGKTASAGVVAVGSEVRIRPTTNSTSSSITAAEVDVELPHLLGTVVSVETSGSSPVIVIEDRDGFQRTIVTSSATTYTVNGSAGTAAAVLVGKTIMAVGAVDANHTSLDATSVNVGRPAAGTAPQGAAPQGSAPQGFGPGGPGF